MTSVFQGLSLSLRRTGRRGPWERGCVCFGIEVVLMIVASLGFAIKLSSPFRTLAFLLAGLLLTHTSAHVAVRSVSALKKVDLVS